MDTKFASSAYRHFLVWGVCSSLAVTICTIVNTSLVGNRIGPDGLAVANLATPVTLLYALFGITIGVGANVHIGRLLGEPDVDGANRIFRAQMGLGLMVGILCLAPLLFQHAFFSFLGVTEELYPLAEQYITIVMWSAPIFVIYHILSISVRTDSNPKLSAIASATVIVTNIALSILLMRGLGWGILGASLSLCVAQLVGTLILLTHFLRKRRLLRLGVSLPTWKEIRSFTGNGFGIGSENVFDAIVMLVFNTLLIRHGGESGALYVAIYGVLHTVGTIPDAIFEGASSALSAVTSFFVGEADTNGITTVLKKALTVAVVGCIPAILCAVFSDSIVWFFGIRNAADIQTASTAMRIFSIGVLFMGINTVVTAFWQSIGRAELAGTMSVIRNLILMLALGAWLIPRWNIIGLAAVYVGAEVLCVLLVMVVLLLTPSRKYLLLKYEGRGSCFEKSYAIDTESMAEIAGDLETVCEEWGIGMKQTFFINFICEELLLNVIKFGLTDTKKRYKYYISIKLMEQKDGYALRIRDNVSLYNPFESQGDEIDAGVLTLIKKKTKVCIYQRKMIFNYLYVVI